MKWIIGAIVFCGLMLARHFIHQHLAMAAIAQSAATTAQTAACDEEFNERKVVEKICFSDLDGSYAASHQDLVERWRRHHWLIFGLDSALFAITDPRSLFFLSFPLKLALGIAGRIWLSVWLIKREGAN